MPFPLATGIIFTCIYWLVISWILKGPSIDLQCPFVCNSLFFVSLPCELYLPWSYGLPWLNIVSSTHGVYDTPHHRVTVLCSLMPSVFYILILYISSIFFNCYTREGKSSPVSPSFLEAEISLVFRYLLLQQTKEVLASQFIQHGPPLNLV